MDRVVRDLAVARFEGALIDRHHSDYHRSRRVWNAMADRRPGLVVRPRAAEDVGKAVHVAADHGVLLAVRGGGHSLPGLSTCDGGIVLDLSGLRGVTIDPTAGRAIAGGGALLGDLDRAAVPLGRVVPAGVISHTGVAGLTLGGGMGWLSRRFGLTIDSLVGAEIVTADGRLRRIGAESEPDLFWAIRGGGGNFGVVTQFEFRTHPLGSVLVGTWLYPPGESAAALRRCRDQAASAPRELSAGFILTAEGLMVTAVHSGDTAVAEQAVSQFGRAGRPRSGQLGGLGFVELQCRSDERMAWNRRYYAKGGFLADITDEVADLAVESMATSPAPDAEVYLLQLGGAVAEVAEDATAYSGRSAGYYWIVETGWDDAAQDQRCLAWNRMTAARLTEVSMQVNYVNEQADHGRDVALAAYDASKYARLARLKARYDPGNLFRLNQNIEPAT
jgi:FAD/FMN-containing dehydrogenase